MSGEMQYDMSVPKQVSLGDINSVSLVKDGPFVHPPCTVVPLIKANAAI
jgi:hypothetical protein